MLRQLTRRRALPSPRCGSFTFPYSCPRQKKQVMGSAQLWISRGKADIQNTGDLP